MELSALVSRQIPYLSGSGINTRFSQPLFPGDLHFPGRKAFGANLRTRRAMNSGFDHNGHVEYYNSGSRSAGNKKFKEIKKLKLKLLEGMAEGLAAQLQGIPISESAEALLQQLEQVEAEEKKLEKAKIKSEVTKTMNDGPSSLSILLSGESEIEEGVTDTNDGVSLDVDVDTDTDDAGSGVDLDIDVDSTGAAGTEVDTGAADIEVDIGAADIDFDIDIDVMDSEEDEITIHTG